MKTRNFGALTSKNLNYTFNGRKWELDIFRTILFREPFLPYFDRLDYVSMLTHEHVYTDHFDSEDNQLSLELTLLQNAIIITNRRKFTDKQNDLLPVVKTIETVVKDLGDSIKENLPIIAGIVGVGVVIYLVWSNWPPRKPPNKNERDDDFRQRVRTDIIDTHGPGLRNILNRIKDLEGYAALDGASQKLVDDELNSLYDSGITRMVNEVTKFTNELRTGTHDYDHDLNSAGFVLNKFNTAVDSTISSYNNALARGLVDNQTFLQYFLWELGVVLYLTEFVKIVNDIMTH